MSLFHARIRRKLLSLIYIGLLVANISILMTNFEPVLASPGLTLKWVRNLGSLAKTYIGPLAADLIGDSRLEIVVTGGSVDGGTDGTVTVLNGTTGSIIWQVTPGGIGMHSPCEIADINNDGILEIIVSGRNPVVLFGDTGSIYWKNTAVSSYNLYSPVYDIDGDGYWEIFVSSGNGPIQGYDYFTVLSYDGKVLRQNPTSWHPCWGGLTIGDTNFDGIFELYQGDRCYGYSTTDPYTYGEWGVRCLDALTLTPLWNDFDITCSSHCPILADIDKDGILDVIVTHQGTTNGGLAVYKATDGSVLTTGGKYRKGLSLGLPSHSQPTVADIDDDGNLEIITCRNTNPKIWDLYDWKLDATLPIVCSEPPKVGDVTGDGKLDIIAVTGSEIYIYSYDEASKTYVEVDRVSGLIGASAFTLVQDVDDDGYNELIVTSQSGRVYCFDTTAAAPNPRVRSETQFYSERNLGAAEYVSPPGPPAPQISEPSPTNGATNIPITLSQLSFKLTDYQHDPISYAVTTTPDIGSGNGINLPNGKYMVPVSNLHYSTTYTWTVNATDGTNTNTKTYTFTTENPPPWWNTDWQHRRKIIIDHTKVSTDQTNFPVLIDLTDSSLSTKAQPDGDDFVFTDSSHNELNHEIELYENNTGHLVAWVNVPLLSSTVDTILYMYYGNPAAENQQNITATWDTSHKMVLHLDEKTGTHYDSTINGNHGTPYNGIIQDASGKIDGADNLDGINDYIEVLHSSTLSGYTEALTVSLWLKLDDVSRRQAILNKYNTVGNQRAWFIEYQNHVNYGKVLGFFASQDGAAYREWYASFNPIAGTWYYITIVWQANAIPKFYINGAQVSTFNTGIIASIYNNVGTPLHIGRSTYVADRYLQGGLDEIRISNPARSTSYILACYNNQKDPSTFYTVGAEETFEEPEPPVISDPYPLENAIGIELNPVLSAKIQDYQGDLMTIIFSTNASGTWQDIGTYINVGNDIYNQTTTNMNSYDTTYCWKIQATDGTSWTNQTYSFTTKPEPLTWWNTDWQYRRVITIDPSKVSSDQTDFPVVIDLTDIGLTDKAQQDGDDFVFTDKSNIKLNHEIESYDYTTGHLVVWINVPYVSSTTETILYMYYGNPAASNQENPMAVWDESHKLVLHLSETHECRMWGMIADSLPHDTVLDHLINMPYSLEALSSSNRDGWGIVYYNDLEPTVLRGPTPAYLDPNYDLAVNEMADSGAQIGVGHVRARSSGAIPAWGNPHPFMRYKNGKWWAFTHNGNLNKATLKSLIGPEYLAANPPTVGTNWDDPDVVDSDLYSLYVLKCIEANNWNVPIGIAQAVTDITKLDSGAANFLLTDGQTLWGFRKGNTLEYYYTAGYSAVASQHPTSTTSGWISLSDYNLITLKRGVAPSIISDIRQLYPLLVDSDLSNSVDSADLRTDSTSQDWYESRNDLPTLLFLDESDIGGNTGKKAGFTASSSKNAYLTQEFSSAQTGTFSVQWDIYVDSILNIAGDPDRAGIMLIGDNSGGTNGPNSADGERFVFLAFHKDGGATSGTADLVWMDTFDIFTPIASVNLDQWYTIKVVLNLVADTYDVYLDGVFIATVPACTAKTSVTHISFAQWNDGAGAFYVDNVFSPTADRYRLTINIEGNGSVDVDPADSSYVSGSEVTLTALPESGWMFSNWNGDAFGTQNPLTITMDGYKTIVANFTEMLLVDSEFDDSVDSADLRANGAGQDWYESRADGTWVNLLYLDESDVGGNTGKKAGLAANASGNAYLSQEFSSAQTGTFSVQWDIYVDSILDITGNPDRTGWMMIGDDSGGTGGPNYPGGERFVVMAFYKDGGGTTGTMDLVARERGAGWTAFTTIVSGLYLKQWYTIKVVCNLETDTYEIYVDGEYKTTVTSYNTKISVTHISFAQWNDGAGAFYVDNVFSPAIDRYKLTVNVIGNGSVTVNPGESTYAAGAEVDLTAIADYGFVFAGWSGDVIDHVNPVTIVMDSDKVVNATFIEPQYSLTINIVGSGAVEKNPDKSTYDYGESVILTASPSLGWSFSYWSGDLSGSENPITIIMDGDKVVTARFIQEGSCIDSTINGNDGLPYGGITQGVIGEIDGAYEFDGIDDYIEVPHSDTLAGYTEAVTISFWLRLDDISRRQAILNKYNTVGNQRAWFIEFQSHVTYGKVLGFFASQDGAAYREWYASFNPTAGTWYYITIVWEANTIPKFYVNGAQVSTINTGTIASIYNNVGVPLHIGRSTYTAGRYLRGSLDEIRISNPTRSADYILMCYNNQKDPTAFYTIGAEESLPTEPIISDSYPTDGATNVPVTLTELSFNLTDYQGDLMDYYVSTIPDIGSDSATDVGDGMYSVAVSGLEYTTTYTWYVNVTDGFEWTNRTYTFTTESPVTELLVDSDFNDSTDSADLRTNSPEQDWYESRNDLPTILFLDESDIGGNTGKKAGFTANSADNAYCTQEFSSPQTGTFTAQWDIYVDSILDVSPRRAGQMLIGTSNVQYSPNQNDAVRFVFLAFYKPGGGTSGTADLVAMLDFDTQVTVASGLNLDQWYTIKVIVDVAAGTYDIYVDDAYKTTVDAVTALSSITHISFAQWNDGAGAFYIDNVYAFKEAEYTLQINVIGSGSVQKDPDQPTYAYGTEVNLTAIADPDWTFEGWSGDLSSTENTTIIIMNSDKIVTATFTTEANMPPVVSDPEPADGATGVQVSTSQLNFTIGDADGDLMDYYLSTTPDIGSESQTGKLDGTYSLSVTNLAYGTTYQWWINVTDGTDWTNASYTFTTESLLLVDSEFNDSVDSADLRANGVDQDWYESRAQVPTLLYLDETDVGGNDGKKAGFTASASGNAYCTQEFSSAQTGVFSVQWDIYVDSILQGSASKYRAGQMMIGSTSASYGPNRNDAVRFVFLAFYKSGGGDSGTADLVAMLDFNTQITVASGLNLDQWYTIRVIVDVAAGTYDVYVDGVFMANVEACTALSSLTHISFAQWDDGAGAFYVDNVFSPAMDRYKLTVNVNGDGVVAVDPSESSYADGAVVSLTPTAESGYMFDHWELDGLPAGSDIPYLVTMDTNHSVIAYFTSLPNVPPEIDDWYPVGDPSILEGESQLFNVTYHDDDGDILTVQWLLNGSDSGSSDEYIFEADYEASGIYNITVAVSDAEYSTTHEWVLTVGDVGPTLLLPFDSDEGSVAIDESGYGNNGTVNGAAWISDYGGCFFFNASEKDYIVVPDDVSLDGGGSWTEITIEFWIKPTIDNKGVRLFEKRSAGSSYQIGFQTTPSSGVTGNQLYWNVWTSTAYKEIVAPFGLETGKWSHVVCWYKDGVGMVIYVNGTLAVSASHTGTINDSTCPINIGRRGDDTSYFTGYLDDIRLYIKALPEPMIQQHYDETKGSYVEVNHTPEIDSYYPDSDPTISEGNSQDFNITCSDLDGDDLLIQWYLDSSPVGTTNSTSYTYTSSSTGTYNVTVMVSDSLAQVSQEWTLTVVAGNMAPEVSNPEPSDLATDVPLSTSMLNFTISDANGDSMSYYVSTSPDIGSDSQTGKLDGTYSLTVSGLTYGTEYTWWINVTDGSDWTNKSYTFTCALLEIEADFDSASIGTYIITGNEINFTLTTETIVNTGDVYTYWTHFKVTNVLNEGVTFRITNAYNVPFLTSTTNEAQLVYSYDGASWYRFTVHSYSEGVYTFSETFNSGNEVYVATFFPFSYTEMQEYIDEVNASPWVTKTVLGSSEQGRDIVLLTITNSSIPDVDKQVIYIIGRQHAHETASSHMLKGMIDFLISDSTDAQRMRNDFVWYIVPMVNPDGVYLGNSRATSELRDPNRDWMNDDSVEISIVRAHINSINATYGIDFFIDWHSQMGDTSWYNFVYSPPGNTFFPILSAWTDFDVQFSSAPSTGTPEDCTAREYISHNVLYDPMFVFEPTPHLYTWTIASLEQQGVNVAYAINEYFPPAIEPLLVDSELNDSVDSADLRANNATAQDWYESRAQVPTLLYLDETDVGGNDGKKAGFTASASGNAYLTQEFSSSQTGVFSVQWDIYVDLILDISGDPDRSGIMMLGSTSASYGPNRNDIVRFVFLAFYKDGGATSGTADLVAMSAFGTFTTVASNLNLDQWYTIRVVVDVASRTYEVYVDGVYKGSYAAVTAWAQPAITHISFAQWNDGAGAFYVDNVFSPAVDRYKLTVNVNGYGIVAVNPGESSYADGAVVSLTPTPDSGYIFDHWELDSVTDGSDVPYLVTMDAHHVVTAVFTAEANVPPEVSNPEPADTATNVPISTSLLNFTTSDGNADLMDYYISTQPDIGSDSALGVSDGTYSLAVSGLNYETAYMWWVNVTDGTDWTNMTFTFTTEPSLLVDSEFTDSTDSVDLRNNGAGQDWYESRADGSWANLLYLDESDVGGNAGKKAGFTASTSGNAYLSQEFSSPQTGTFTVQWDIYVDSILDISGTDATAWMMIGDDSVPSSPGPNYPLSERFVYMAFYKNGGATSGPVDLVCRLRGTNTLTTITSLNLDQWYTIKVVVNVPAGTYDVYVDGAFMRTCTSRNAKTSVTHISFAQWNDGAGAFYIDNVFSPAQDRYKLTVTTVGSGSVQKNLSEATYASNSIVTLTAVADSGWFFSEWSGDLTGNQNPINITMDEDKTVTATFNEIQGTFTIIVLPDTQFYSQSYPAIFTNQTQWIVNNVAGMNVSFVLHEGDIVNSDIAAQWINANGSMSLLNGYVPWAVLPGNHDGTDVGGPSENLINYNTYFPYSRFSSETWYGDAYNDINTNSFVLFSGGGDDYIIFNFQYHPSDAVLAWANTTLAAWPNRRAIVVTHDYLNTGGTRTTEGNHIWNNFVAPHADQIFLVLCGHMHSASTSEARRQDTVNGYVVYQLLADYQERPNGGNGWLRILQFHPAEDKIYVKTYSPYLNSYETDEDSQFILDYEMSTLATLTSADPELTSPSGDYRWMDVADQTYSVDYINSYNYSQASVKVIYDEVGSVLTGRLIATNLKPNFAYQLKLVGTPGTDDNERIGLAGRWWQEEWNGTAWTNGWNLNDKGDGSLPNPNDLTYFDRRYIVDISSPTGYHYRYTGYLLFAYFITDSNGNAEIFFETGNCYHVLWKTTQRAHTADDGPLDTVTFDPDPSEFAYDVDYSNSTITVFGEWERLPMGGVHLSAGEYNCQIVLTEESFHGSGPLEGNWACAMNANISFTITA